mgnify:CR=1 FL=1
MRISLKNAMQLCLGMPSLYRVVEFKHVYFFALSVSTSYQDIETKLISRRWTYNLNVCPSEFIQIALLYLVKRSFNKHQFAQTFQTGEQKSWWETVYGKAFISKACFCNSTVICILYIRVNTIWDNTRL